MRTKKFWILVFLIGFLAVSCGGSADPEVETTDQPVASDSAVTLVPDTESPVQYEGRTSQCGGFSVEPKILISNTSCNEIVLWTYDQQNHKLVITHKDLILNCGAAGGLNIELVPQGAGFKVIEKEHVESPAHCHCSFDYEITLLSVVPGSYPVEIVHKNDSTEILVWKGTLDLSLQSGSFEVNRENCP